MRRRTNSTSLSIAILYLTVCLYVGISWVTNLIQLFNLDFEAPYKDEIIKLIGVFIPPLSTITVWY